MASIIHVLDEKTINQIAAGEVIENAASCVKELVENAIDASATQIEVSVLAGGRQKIEVVDNGKGMSQDDTLLSLERHATSKIRKIEDMDLIASMGFRGEAIASIAAISRFSIHSSDGNESSKVIAHGGKIVDHLVSPRQRGTTVTVSSLFYNVPARQKFQKSVGHDNRNVHQMMVRLALAHPTISFKFSQDDQEIFHLIPNPNIGELENLHLRIQSLFGSELCQPLKEMDIEIGGVKIRGYVGSAMQHRPSRLGQYLFINSRYVDSKLVSMAVREGYSTRLPEGRFPIFFLYLDLDPQQIDVNVHPQKKEIRFKDPFEIKRLISEAVNRTLSNPLPTLKKSQGVKKEVFFQSHPGFESEPSHSVEEVQVLKQEEPQFFPNASLAFVPNVVGVFKGYFFLEAKSVSSKLTLKESEISSLVLVHQRRAQECILYHHLMQSDAKVEVQNLLLAETFEFSPHEAKIVHEYLDTFDQLGILMRSIGKNSFMVDGLPARVPSVSVKDLIESVIEEVSLGSTKKTLEEQKKQILAAAVAKSVPWKMIEHTEEAAHIITQLFQCSEFEYSPKGHPVMSVMTLAELARRFK